MIFDSTGINEILFLPLSYMLLKLCLSAMSMHVLDNCINRVLCWIFLPFFRYVPNVAKEEYMTSV